MKFDHYKDVECFEYLEVYVHKTPLLEDILLEIVSEIQLQPPGEPRQHRLGEDLQGRSK